jgi:hypothetical protein
MMIPAASRIAFHVFWQFWSQITFGLSSWGSLHLQLKPPFDGVPASFHCPRMPLWQSPNSAALKLYLADREVPTLLDRPNTAATSNGRRLFTSIIRNGHRREDSGRPAF